MNRMHLGLHRPTESILSDDLKEENVLFVFKMELNVGGSLLKCRNNNYLLTINLLENDRCLAIPLAISQQLQKLNILFLAFNMLY